MRNAPLTIHRVHSGIRRFRARFTRCSSLLTMTDGNSHLKRINFKPNCSVAQSQHGESVDQGWNSSFRLERRRSSILDMKM